MKPYESLTKYTNQRRMEKNREYYESLDKRTREFKDWKAKQAELEAVHYQMDIDELKQTRDEMADSVGLGDMVEKITEVTGIKSAVEHLFGEDCGCDERKEKLNNFGRKLRDLFRTPRIHFLTKVEYNYLKDFKSRYNGRELTKTDQIELLKIHNRVFQTKKELSSCASCLKDLCNKMIMLHDNYEKN